MSDKAIIVTDMPKSCSKCEFLYEFYGVKKCQLLNIFNNGGKAIIGVDKLNDARKECCPLTSLQEHDKEIRDKAINEFAKKIKEATYQWFKTGTIAVGMIDEIAEQIKQTQQTHECD